MYPIDNDMKDFFNPQDRSDLPAEFSWENMEAGILDKMNKMQPEEGPLKESFITQNKYYLTLAALLLAVMTYLGFHPENNNILGSIQETSNVEDIKKNTKGNLIETLNHPSNSKGAHALLNDSVKTNEPSKATQLNRLAQHSRASEIIYLKNSLGTSRPYESSKSTLQNYQGILERNPQFEEPTSPDPILILSKKLTPIQSETTKTDFQIPNREALISFKKSILSQDSALLPFRKKAKNQSKNQLSFESGMCFWDEGSRSNTSNSFENPLPSYQIQGLYKWSVNGNTFLLTGLQYQRLNSKLDFRTTIPDYLLVLTDTVVRIYKDVSTGEIEKVYGNVEQTVVAERLVVHHNTSDLFKILLGVGRQITFKGFHTDFFGGIAINTVSLNQGRTVVNGQIVDYNGGSNAIMHNRIYAEFFWWRAP